ncbi:hypothetical protein [Salinisphaera sp. G21_0]|uniref:hypothetical protein n=1 Tax=Salinisphaera sp. G21_0 TaxID=2821094 RepID=UPI001ADCA4D1|nr:hypothetical protein [Salinisphaera sp. G21_0]MBO9484715.1 hypothetical protein [Salinisphaera sp. G21_0]
MTELGEKKNQRWKRNDYPDIHWFRRGRECLTCGHNFITAEADESLLDELARLRGKLEAARSKTNEIHNRYERVMIELDEISDLIPSILKNPKIGT